MTKKSNDIVIYKSVINVFVTLFALADIETKQRKLRSHACVCVCVPVSAHDAWVRSKSKGKSDMKVKLGM